MLKSENLGNPPEFWEYFEQISAIPRCSGHEDRIREHVKRQAENLMFQTRVDKVGNLLVRIPSTDEESNKIIIQSHLDMVCEKNQNVIHDFSKDPLNLKIIEIDNEKWITADGTTLGADNGTGIAYQLALMKKVHDKELNFNNLSIDLLFTVSEEDGLTGAFQMEENMITGEYLINLDGGEEDPNNIIIGSAGAGNMDIDIKVTILNIKNENDHFLPVKLHLKGLVGGHSGADIHRGRANALKLIARVLKEINEHHEIYLTSIDGGNKTNAIPRECNSIFFVKKKELSSISSLINTICSEINKEYLNIEHNVEIVINSIKSISYYTIIKKEEQDALIHILNSLPCGPLSYHPDFPDIVHTSMNLASIKTKKSRIKIKTSQRSFDISAFQKICNNIEKLANSSILNATVREWGYYGPWNPDFTTLLLKIAKNAFYKSFNQEPIVKPVHVTLETGIFKERFPHLQMITIGAHAKGLHSPDERLQVKCVERIWNGLIKILQDFSQIIQTK